MLPTVAEVLALDPLRRGAPRVVAAADGLDAPVRWVHVIELAEAAHLLRGGELVLSTGIALPDDPSGLTRYVADLASVGVSALAVELGSRYARSLPAALVSAAASHRLPLIVLQRETQFIEITEAVHARIIDTQLEELRASEHLHQVFTDLASVGVSALGSPGRAMPVDSTSSPPRSRCAASASSITWTQRTGASRRSAAATTLGAPRRSGSRARISATVGSIGRPSPSA